MLSSLVGDPAPHGQNHDVFTGSAAAQTFHHSFGVTESYRPVLPAALRVSVCVCAASTHPGRCAPCSVLPARLRRSCLRRAHFDFSSPKQNKSLSLRRYRISPCLTSLCFTAGFNNRDENIWSKNDTRPNKDKQKVNDKKINLAPQLLSPLLCH